MYLIENKTARFALGFIPVACIFILCGANDKDGVVSQIQSHLDIAEEYKVIIILIAVMIICGLLFFWKEKDQKSPD